MCTAWGVACLIASGAGAVGGPHTGVVILALSGIVFAVGECLHAVVLQPLIAELAPPALVGRYMALFGITFSVGLAAGPSASASALAVSPELPWIAGAVAMLALLPVLSPVVRRAQVPRALASETVKCLGVTRFSPFRDRDEAGRRLAAELPELDRPLVLALPRGGVPVGAALAGVLGAELDVLVVRKLGVPVQPELAMGAVASGGVRVVNEDVVRRAGVPAAVLEEVAARELAAVESRERLYRGDRPAPALPDATWSSSTTGSRPARRCGRPWRRFGPAARADSSSRSRSRPRKPWSPSRGTGSRSCACTRPRLRLGGFVVRRFRAGIRRGGDSAHLMTTFVDKLVAEEHHLEEIARDGYAPATLPIVLGAIVLALAVIVGLALGVTLPCTTSA